MKQQNLIVELNQRNAITENISDGSNTNELLKSIEDKTKQITELQTTLGSKEADIKELKNEIERHKAELLTRVSKEQFDKLQQRYDTDINFKQEIDAMETLLNQTIGNGMGEMKTSVDTLKEAIERNSLVVELNKQLTQAQAQIQELNSQKTDLHTENTNVKLQNQNLQNRIALLESQQETPEQSANRGFLVQQFKDTTIEDFYAMYSRSAAMQETGLYVTPWEFNYIMNFFLSKLPHVVTVTPSMVTNLKTEYVLDNLAYTYNSADYTDGKIKLKLNIYNGIDELKRLTYYPTLDFEPFGLTNYSKRFDYLKQFNASSESKINFRIPINLYNLKFLFAKLNAGSYKNHSHKVKYEYYFELSDGTFTGRKLIRTHSVGYADSENILVSKIQTFFWDKVPENTVALILETSVEYANTGYNDFTIGLPIIHGI